MSSSLKDKKTGQSVFYWQQSGESVCEESFYSWLHKEPQNLVWLPTLHRLIATKSGELWHDADVPVRYHIVAKSCCLVSQHGDEIMQWLSTSICHHQT